MISIEPTAAYVHRCPRPEAWEGRLRAIVEADKDWLAPASRIWQLLDTPHTVMSLVRALSPEEFPDPRWHSRVEVLLRMLMQEDLIELSQDA